MTMPEAERSKLEEAVREAVAMQSQKVNGASHVERRGIELKSFG